MIASPSVPSLLEFVDAGGNDQTIPLHRKRTGDDDSLIDRVGATVFDASATSTDPLPPMPDQPPGPVYAPAPPPGPVYAPPPPGYQPPAPPSMYQAPAAPPAAEAGVMEDANADRALIAPSAMPPPAGTFSFTNYEIVWLTASYSPSDNLQLTAGTLIPLSSDLPFVGTLGGKLQIVHQDRLRVALHGVIGGGSDAGNGGALTFCLDDSCHSRVKGYLGAGFASDGGAATPILGSVSGVFPLSRLIRAFVEIDSGYVAEISAARLTLSFSTTPYDLPVPTSVCEDAERKKQRRR
jgi:hypothetical protein